MDAFGKALGNLQVTVVQATSSAVTTVSSSCVQVVDNLHGNNVASTTHKTINAVSTSIDTICESIGLQRR